MKYWTFFLGMILALMLPFAAFGNNRVEWSYDGHLGPETWGNLDPAFRMCSEGTQQSPVDLSSAVETELFDVKIEWTQAEWMVENTGRTISMMSEAAGHAIIDDQRYDLIGIEFRNPSEHQIDGLGFPMEVQFKHRHENGSLAVIAVVVRGGGSNSAFDALIGVAPIEDGDESNLSDFNPSFMITDIGDILRYQGSLTMPPCSENVLWTVLMDPLVVSDAALLAFNSLFALNARPLQPLNRRYILTD